MALPEPFLIRQKARATDNPDGVSHAKLEAKLTDPERPIIAHALSAAAKPYENDASFAGSELTAYKALRGSLFMFSCPLRTARCTVSSRTYTAQRLSEFLFCD
jgi:hypothetical protein